jgi:GGDEF domain-containing protein
MAPNAGFAQTRLACYQSSANKRPKVRFLDASARALFERRSEIFVIFFGLLLVAATGCIDYWTGPELSVAPFYLVPIAIGAWCGGFSHGILLALAATAVWHLTDMADFPAAHIIVRIWNAVVRFGFFVIASSLLARLRSGLLREQTLARTDPLTGAANGRTFYEIALLELERFGRTQQPFTVVYLDLDNFKAVNDQLGHSTGDGLLRQVAETIAANTRANDIVARRMA